MDDLATVTEHENVKLTPEECFQAMKNGYETFNEQMPQLKAGSGQTLGRGLFDVIGQLTSGGFSWAEAISLIGVIIDYLQQHQGDIQKVVDQIRKMFGR